MKIKLSDATEIEVQLKGKHAKKILKCYSSLTADDTDMGKAMDEYNAMIESIAAEVTGKSSADFDEMDIDDVNTILNKIQEKALGRMDFIQSSLMSAGSAQKTSTK